MLGILQEAKNLYQRGLEIQPASPQEAAKKIIGLIILRVFILIIETDPHSLAKKEK